MLKNTTLKQDQKEEPEESRSKAKKIIVEGNLNSFSFFCFKVQFNFAVFRVFHGSIFPKLY